MSMGQATGPIYTCDTTGHAKGPCTLDDGLMPDDLFESVATDTAQETSGRQIGLIHRSGVPHMCTSKAPRACPAANQPTAQRCAAPVGVPTASAMPAPARECAEACLLAQTLLEPATSRARAGCDEKKTRTRCPA